MGYERVILYFMSGTGNTFRAATWMLEAAEGTGSPARLVPIEEGRPEEEIDQRVEDLVGVAMPTHGFIAPWPVIRFVMRFPRGRGTHAFVVPTRAGMRFGRVCTPGMEGTAGYLVALLLLLKGYSVRGVMGLDMPSNWLSLHPGLHPSNVRVIIARGREKTLRFMERLLSGGTSFGPGSLVELFFGLLLLPVSLGYLLVGRFFLAKLFFPNYDCDGCGLCAANCPNGAIRMWGKKKARPYWTFDCESCMRCMGYCPRNAIEAGHSLGVVIYYVTSIPVSLYLMNTLGKALPWFEGLDNRWTRMLLQYPYILLSIFITYLLFTLLIRMPFVNRLFTYTTLTRFYRRYHEPETKLKDIKVKRGPVT